MPVPFIPLALIILVVDVLAFGHENEEERRTDCISVALVCKAWKEVGIAAAWRRLTIIPYEHAGLVAWICRRPHVLAAIHTLTLERLCRIDQPASASSMPELLTSLVQLVANCSHLIRLCVRLGQSVGLLVQAAALYPHKHYIQKLDAAVSGTYDNSTVEHVDLPPTPESESKLRFDNVNLLLHGHAEDARDSSYQALLPVVDPSTLKSVFLGPLRSADAITPLLDGTSPTRMVLRAADGQAAHGILQAISNAVGCFEVEYERFDDPKEVMALRIQSHWVFELASNNS
ncbi:hypothetical protein JCM11251_003283 [Rhodosporidiobolus azoricus]